MQKQYESLFQRTQELDSCLKGLQEQLNYVSCFNIYHKIN
jgi:hypothetical protein